MIVCQARLTGPNQIDSVPGVVSERAVGLSHAVRVLTGLDSLAFAVIGVGELDRKSVV